MKTKSWSTGDLQALARTRASEQQHHATAAAEGAHVAAGISTGGGQPSTPATQVAAAMRKTQSHGSLAAAVGAGQDRDGIIEERRCGMSTGEVPHGGAPLHHRHRSSHALGSVAEEAAGEAAASPTGSPQAAAKQGGTDPLTEQEGPADEARPQMMSAKNVLRALSRRSEGQSVEDAIESLAAEQAPAVSAKQQGARRLLAAAAEAAEPPVAGWPAPALRSPVVQPGVPLPSPAVTAQVQLSPGAGAAGGTSKTVLEQPTPAEARPASPHPHAQRSTEGGAAHKRTHFWHFGKAHK
jgi:hypothetical protein